MTRFSHRYTTSEDWLKATKPGKYRSRIERLHVLYPRATLSQLRGHPRSGQRGLSSIDPVYLVKRSIHTLSQGEKTHRYQALSAVSEMRRNPQIYFTRTCKKYGVSPRVARRHVGDAIDKVGGRWQASPRDSISRLMVIYTDGTSLEVEINNSETASVIGRYMNAVQQFYLSGDPSVLAEFEGMRIRDAQGNQYVLETDPDALWEIYYQMEEPEFQEIYQH